MKLQKKLNYDGFISVDRRGHSAGLAMLWKKDGSLRLLGHADHYIDVEITIDRESPYRVTGFYGYVDRALRRRSWDFL